MNVLEKSIKKLLPIAIILILVACGPEGGGLPPEPDNSIDVVNNTEFAWDNIPGIVKQMLGIWIISDPINGSRVFTVDTIATDGLSATGYRVTGHAINDSISIIWNLYGLDMCAFVDYGHYNFNVINKGGQLQFDEEHSEFVGHFDHYWAKGSRY